MSTFRWKTLRPLSLSQHGAWSSPASWRFVLNLQPLFLSASCMCTLVTSRQTVDEADVEDNLHVIGFGWRIVHNCMIHMENS